MTADIDDGRQITTVTTLMQVSDDLEQDQLPTKPALTGEPLTLANDCHVSVTLGIYSHVDQKAQASAAAMLAAMRKSAADTQPS